MTITFSKGTRFNEIMNQVKLKGQSGRFILFRLKKRPTFNVFHNVIPAPNREMEAHVIMIKAVCIKYQPFIFAEKKIHLMHASIQSDWV